MQTTRDDDVSLLSSITRTAILGAALVGFSLVAREFCGPTQRSAAEIEARAWAKGLHLPIDAVTCKDIDPGADGHLTCMVAVGGKIHHIECKPAGRLDHGCTAAKPVSPAPADSGVAR